ncbi:hypothetical protein [Mycoplasmopsis cynos]|uniref:Helix-turn-helix domain, rpiR family n=1 Tax=Mycoplasmopsis cynos TaxID=171284 RepID=A0A449AHY1_9BACT|nr:hypothetical protein [Mycoplasmopsis cynos]TQC54589.1 hypothetical protein E1I74_02475 [Mycoplasmopsis cynos]VEU64591.1 Helix-turn-helix domain, rpiR family [Mycoplasmopsis cynos]
MKLFIKNDIKTLSSTEKKLVEFALIKPKEFYSYSIKQLSFKINISIGTISKLIKKN